MEIKNKFLKIRTPNQQDLANAKQWAEQTFTKDYAQKPQYQDPSRKKVLMRIINNYFVAVSVTHRLIKDFKFTEDKIANRSEKSR